LSDSSTAPELLTVSSISGDELLFPAGSITFGGSGASRTVTLTPAPNRFGVAEIQISADDGNEKGSEVFVVTVEPQAPGTVVAAFRSSGWRYSSTAVSPPDGWQLPGFNDSTWPADNGAFSHPLPSPNFTDTTDLGAVQGRVTCYFRRQFTAPAPVSGVPMVRLACDDGAVIYVNGIEAARHNMPGGSIYPDTPASESVEGEKAKQIHIYPVDPALIIPGQTNTIAVEVHDAVSVRIGTVRDVYFDMDMAFRQPPTMSALANTEAIEGGLVQQLFTAQDAEMGGGRLTFSFITSDPAALPPQALEVVPSASVNEYKLRFAAPAVPGVVQVIVRVSDGFSETWRSFTHTTTPRDDPPQMWSIPSQTAVLGQTPNLIKVPVSDPDTPLKDLDITFDSSSSFLVHDWAITKVFSEDGNTLWLKIQPNAGAVGYTDIDVRLSYTGGSKSSSFRFTVVAGANAVASPATLVPKASQWLMWAAPLPGGAKPIDFTDVNLDDSTWTAVTTPAEAAIPAAPARVTTYFRRSFEGTPAGVGSLALNLRCDDGAAVYLNGVLVAHTNLPAGVLEADTLATKEVAEEDELTWQNFTLSP
ncbi:MAG: hypothetical protein JNG86_23245, partial [Verrucomicrobiaceae bacterium]|nr:hypothetical protein [Verrucomicrobiaceae bacterium]